jgi:hypothetical protein
MGTLQPFEPAHCLRRLSLGAEPITLGIRLTGAPAARSPLFLVKRMLVLQPLVLLTGVANALTHFGLTILTSSRRD